MADASGKNNAGETRTNASELECEQWEALLADKMDAEGGRLAPEVEAVFVEHSGKCPGCAELLEQARQGRQWLRLLEASTPAAPVDLLSRILAKTQGAGREADFAIGTGAAIGGQAARWGIPFLAAPHSGMIAARGAQNARMLMTAGMAFFSIALTLSLVGVRLTSVHAAELRPQVVQANVSRSFYGTKKQVVSFYENLRLVYEVESKMHDIRHDSDAPAEGPTPPPRGSGAGASKTGSKAGAGPAAGQSPDAPPKTTPGKQKQPAGPGHAGAADRGGEQAQPVLYGWAVSVRYAQARPRPVFERADLLACARAGSAAPRGARGSKCAPGTERNRS